MTNSTHKHKWKFIRHVWFGCLYGGNLRAKSLLKCDCGKVKLGKRLGPDPQEDPDWYDENP